ncbi:FG-GAP repeat protein [Holosporaceae bacterium 'Namur']|nr:FG-GAP repeat protein [Holosporaceae bacterium 'Namur']
MSSLNNAFSLSSLNGKNGFKMVGNKNENIGWQVSRAGDINGDGIEDLIVAASSANEYTGKAYVVFGSDDKFSSKINVSKFDGSSGFVINGETPKEVVGFSVSGAGDMNGDGIDDIIIGAPGENEQLGAGYVMFGSKSKFPSGISVSDLDGSNGFKIIGDSDDKESSLGFFVSGAGDMNGDGLADIIISAPQGIKNNGGISYVLYGSNLTSYPIMDLANSQDWKGFKFHGVPNSISGQSISGLGDINGDGLDDIVIGAHNANNGKGAAYVVFGSKIESMRDIYPSSLDGKNGFKIQSEKEEGYLGSSVSGVGDINGDGYNDFVVSTTSSGPCGNSPANYVFYGKESFSESISISDIDEKDGFIIKDGMGTSLHVNGAGDVNNDGLGDLIISKSYAMCGGRETSYVLFGNKSGFQSEIDINKYNFNGINGFQINKVHSEDSTGYSVSTAGDVNNDGIADFVLGAPNAGVSYLVFGTEEIIPYTDNDGIIGSFFSLLSDAISVYF